MKRNILGIVFCCFLLTLPAVSAAASGMYGRVGVGAAMAADSGVTVDGVSAPPETEYDTGYTAGIALGFMIEQFRLEGEVSYQSNDVDTHEGVPYNAEVTNWTYLANSYLDFDIDSPVMPYVTVGIGAITVEWSEPGWEYDDTVFAYQLGVGIGYALSESLTFDFGYRYLGASDVEFNDGVNRYEFEVASHNLNFGLRMAF